MATNGGPADRPGRKVAELGTVTSSPSVGSTRSAGAEGTTALVLRLAKENADCVVAISNDPRNGKFPQVTAASQGWIPALPSRPRSSYDPSMNHVPARVGGGSSTLLSRVSIFFTSRP